MPYATENKVRLTRGFYYEETFGEEEGILTDIQLEQEAFNIITLAKTTGITRTALTAGTDFDFLPPHKITLKGSGIGVGGDFFHVVYGTKISAVIVTSALEQATAIIQASLESQYENDMDTWETLDAVVTETEPGGSPLAPNLVEELCADIAGCEATISFFRRSGDYDAAVMTQMRLEKKMLMDRLDMIQLGKLKLPDIDTVILVDERNPDLFNFADEPQLSHIDFLEEEERVETRGTRRSVVTSGGKFFS